MADFNTHLMGAATVSGLAATVLAMTGVAPSQAVVGYFALGVIGGLLPDIDSSTSIPVRVAFNVLAVTAGFLLVFTFGARYSLLELIILWLGCYFGIRHGLRKLFTRYTTHRGLIHSIPAGVGFGLATVVLADHGFNATAVHAWTCGAFVTMGFLVHLLLDEFYSVNLYGKKLLKNSFGTAFCLGGFNQPLGTVALYAALIGLLLLCPSPRPFADVMLDRAIYRGVVQRLWPTGTWFPGFLRRVTPPGLAAQ